MRRTLYKIISKFVQLWYRVSIPNFSGTFYLSPEPNYISQFVGIYPSSISPNTLLKNTEHAKEFGAKDCEEFTFWAWRNCGIACVKMILDAKVPGNKLTMMQLTKEGKKLGGYILYKNGIFVDKGWFHQSLVSLLDKYGVMAKMKKFQSLESVTNDILNNRMVILSVEIPGRKNISEDGSFKIKKNAALMGHLILGIGVKVKGNNIEGIFVHDPRGLKNYQKNRYIPRKIFEQIFTNRSIVVL